MGNKKCDKKSKKDNLKKYLLWLTIVFIFITGVFLIRFTNINKMTIEEKVEFKINSMSIKEKINQMMYLSMRYTIQDNEIIGLSSLNRQYEAFLKRNNPGGIILFSDNIESGTQLTNFINSINNNLKKYLDL